MTTTPQKGNRRERSEAIKKEFARAERRRRLMFLGSLGIVVAVLIALAAVGIRNVSENSGKEKAADLKSASGQGAESAPPWPLPADVGARAETAGLEIGAEGTGEHYHAHVDVLVDGKSVPVPVNIGVDPSSGGMSAMHTHSPDGLIHVEAATKGKTYTLGQLFTQWNVRLSSKQIGSLTTGAGNTLSAYVDGKKVAGDPAMIRLADRQQIALVYGPKDAKVDVPDSFDFG
jgi:hypothetical protein